MRLIFHDSTICAAKSCLKLIDASVGHWHLLVLVYVCLLLRINAVDSRASWIHFVLLTLCLAAKSISCFETVHILFFLIFINVLLFHHHLFIKPIILFMSMYMHLMHLFAYQLTLVCLRWLVEIWCSMERIVHVPDVRWDFRSWTDGMRMQWLLLALT